MANTLIPVDPKERKRWISGVLLLLLSVVLAYWFMVYPLCAGLRTGSVHYDPRQILCPPLLAYCAFILLFTRIQKGELGRRTARGRNVPNKKGWFVLLGGLLFVLTVFAVWSFYAESLGYHDAPPSSTLTSPS